MELESKDLLVTAAPHLRSRQSTSSMMWTVTACLAPAGIWGIVIFGARSLWVLLASIAAALLTEFVFNLFRRESTLSDGSAFLTGLLVGLNMPPEIPGFIPMVASFFAIAVVKQTFGGLGRNWMNPALAGRVFVMFSWTGEMTQWTNPSGGGLAALLGGSSADAVSGATALAKGSDGFLSSARYWDLAIGNVPGSIGEVSAILLVLGALVLLAMRIINWEIPVSYLGVFALLTWMLGGLPAGGGVFSGDPLFHLLAGGILLGAFYMATDLVTSPLSGKGMLLYGAGIAILTFLIRFYGGFPEGVSLAIIVMNTVVPLINRVTQPVKFGAVREARE